MSRLAIDKEFLRDFGALEKTVRAKVEEVFSKFESATHTGLHLEAVNKARDSRFRTIRIDKFWRGVVLAPDSGEVYTLLKVLPHDDAYKWAQRRKVTVNNATGRIEIRDVEAIDATLPELSRAAERAPQRLFQKVNEADLRRLGLDEQTLTFARALTHEIQLDASRVFLPQAQWDVLAGLAAGMTVEEVWSDLGASASPVDIEDVDVAVARSTERLVLVEGPEELLAVLRSPFDLWRVYLHPTQQRMASTSFSGPARVTGGPGTGKTVVALHRARRLAVADDGPVLLTTFTTTLARSLQTGVVLLVDDPAVQERIEVATLDSIARQIFVKHHGSPQMAGSAVERQIWRELIGKHNAGFSETFLSEEWRQVVLARQVSSIEGYQAVRRSGRGRKLGARQQEQLWPLLDAFSKELTEMGMWTYETVCIEAARLAEQSPTRPYRHAVVDEAQDVSPLHWRLLRAIVTPGRDDLFIAGDAHQRIYAHQISLREVGIPISGRSARLTLNYRTTAEILAWSLGMLKGERIDDLDAGLESVAGYRSQLHGRPPNLTGYTNRNAELAGLATTVQGWLDQGVRPSEIGVAGRSKAVVEAALGVLTAAGLNDHLVPAALTPVEEDPATHNQDLQRERCLLFVACTRAREQLAVSWYGNPSRFLAEALG